MTPENRGSDDGDYNPDHDLTVWNVVDHGLAAIFFGIAATAMPSMTFTIR